MRLVGEYDPKPGGSQYGRDSSSIDDFADSFAAYILTEVGWTTNIPMDSERRKIIDLWISPYTQ